MWTVVEVVTGFIRVPFMFLNASAMLRHGFGAVMLLAPKLICRRRVSFRRLAAG
jgi:hypothetical protein